MRKPDVYPVVFRAAEQQVAVEVVLDLSERSLMSYISCIQFKVMTITKGWDAPCRRMGRWARLFQLPKFRSECEALTMVGFKVVLAILGAEF